MLALDESEYWVLLVSHCWVAHDSQRKLSAAPHALHYLLHILADQVYLLFCHIRVLVVIARNFHDIALNFHSLRAAPFFVKCFDSATVVQNYVYCVAVKE